MMGEACQRYLVKISFYNNVSLYYGLKGTLLYTPINFKNPKLFEMFIDGKE